VHGWLPLSRSLSSASARPSPRRSPPMPNASAIRLAVATGHATHQKQGRRDGALVRCCGEARSCHGEFLLLRVRGGGPVAPRPSRCCARRACGWVRRRRVEKWPAERAKRLGLSGDRVAVDCRRISVCNRGVTNRRMTKGKTKTTSFL
jgi:hypothetical protein